MISYKKYLQSKNLKPSTIKNYLWHIDKFLKWLDTRTLNESELKQYFSYLLKRYPRVNTINLRLKILNNYLLFLNKKFTFDLLSNENLNLKILNKEQLNMLLKNPLKTKGLIGLRDKTLLELLYNSGLKVGQIVTLKISQIDQIKNSIIISPDFSLKIKPTVWFYLKKYLEARHDNIDYLFINFDRADKSSKKHLSIRSVERIIGKYAKNINPPIDVSPQILRNTLAYHLKSQGAQSEHIQSALHFQTKTAAKNYLKQI